MLDAGDATEAEQDIRARYAKVLGSAVNPVLREGNSDRRVAGPVKEYARNNPHSMGEWSSQSKSHVAHMQEGDFFGSEQSHIMDNAGTVSIELINADGETTTLKSGLELEAGEVIDSSVMSKNALWNLLPAIADAKKQDVLLSLHMKATMMKVSDPKIFGHVVKVYYADVFEKHSAVLDELGVDPNNGIGDLYNKIGELEEAQKAEILADIDAVYEKQPRLAMVNSDKGITNLHVPSDVIIDASVPACVPQEDVGAGWRTARHQSNHSGSQLCSCTRQFSNSAKRTELSMCRPWVMFPTWD